MESGSTATAPTLTFAGSSIGKKVVMAVTGIVLVGFVIGHMLGNLQLYAGSAALNAYAAFLHEALHGGGLWITRAVLLGSVALHVWSAYALTMQNRAARPVGYREWKARESTYASRTMRWSGVILLAFIVFHLLHFTTGTVHPDYMPGEVFHNVVTGLRVAPAAIVYMIAMALLGVHLYHGVWSMLQTLGLSHARYNHLRNGLSALVASVVVIGNLSFPIAVLSGAVH